MGNMRLRLLQTSFERIEDDVDPLNGNENPSCAEERSHWVTHVLCLLCLTRATGKN
jgi:hypothetical protein